MSIYNKENIKKICAGGFIPITNFPAFTHYSASSSLTPFINTLYTYTIGIAAILAVIEIIWGGFLWMGSGASVSSKEAGRQKILMSILGLVLVLSPYLILSIINPNMLSLRLGVKTMNVNTKKIGAQTFATPKPPAIACSYSYIGLTCSSDKVKQYAKKYNLLCQNARYYGVQNTQTKACLYNKLGYGKAVPVYKYIASLKKGTSKQRDACLQIAGSVWHFIRRASVRVLMVKGGCSGTGGQKIVDGEGYTCVDLVTPPKGAICIYNK